MAKFVYPLFCQFILTILFTGSLAYLFPIEPRGPLPGTPSPPGSPWPLPASWKPTNNLVTIGLRSDYEYISNVPNCEPLTWAFNWFNYDFLFRSSLTPDEQFPILSKIQIIISENPAENQCNTFPKLDTDASNEAYNLTIRGNGNEATAVIEAKTVWGGLRGLETFTQLLFDSGTTYPAEHFYVNETEISDWPRFPHRGFMLDTARHYYPERVIHEILDAMFYNKFNVFHWHIVDDQSFPFVSKTFPDLSVKGAYNDLAIYSPEMVNRTLHHARLRGIRVVFEFDTPGHTNAMGRANPEILTPCYGDGETPGTPDYPEHSAFENLDPTRETTYDFIRSLFSEVVDVSQDDYVHLGMDEVYYPCWNSSPVIAEFMQQNGYVNMSQVQAHYTTRHLEIMRELGSKSILWQDPIDAGVTLDPDVVVQIWKDWGEGGWPNYLQNALDAGHQVLLSAPWYINYISYGQTWKSYYEIDPILDLPNILPEQVEQVLGGEVCLWSEYTDKTNVIPRLFPFASAVAERLWSPAQSSTTDDAMWRLDLHRCRMLWRGLSAQPLLPGYCGAWEVDT